MESRGEPWLGQLAVAYVAVNRVSKWNQELPDVLLDPYEFSVWNRQRFVRGFLQSMTQDEFQRAYAAAVLSLGHYAPDPSLGATHFLNVDKVLKDKGTLPWWYEASQVTVRIGGHTFLRGGD